MYFDDKKNIITKIDEYKIHEGNINYINDINSQFYEDEMKKEKKAISLVKLNSN